jgi:hypothetical protein
MRASVGTRAVLALVGIAAATPVRADRIVIRGGGEIRGVVLPQDGESTGIVRVLTPTASRPMEFRGDQIREVVADPADPLHEYVERSSRAGQTGAERVELASWCERNGLSGPAQIEYRRAIEAEPQNAVARKKLGYVYHNGTWLTYAEQKRAQGLVQYKGKWLAPEEKAEQERQQAFGAAQKTWARRLSDLRRRWLGPDAAARESAEGELLALRDPAAAAPLARVFGGDDPSIRIRVAQWLGGIPGEEAREELIRLVLREESHEVRQAALRELDSRREGETPARLVEALKAKEQIIVSRAAWALGTLGVTEAIPRLIAALVRVETQTVMEPGGGGMGVAFGTVGPGPVIPGGAAVGAVPGATVGVGPAYAAGPSIPVLTGPVVGNGVVAYGATSVPFGAFTGFATGGANPNAPVIRDVTNVYRNEEVLLALRTLTGVDHGFDQAAWRRWFAEEFRPAGVPPDRRAPQP